MKQGSFLKTLTLTLVLVITFWAYQKYTEADKESIETKIENHTTAYSYVDVSSNYTNQK